MTRTSNGSVSTLFSLVVSPSVLIKLITNHEDVINKNAP